MATSNISIATCLTSRRDQSERIKHKKAQSHKKLQVEKVIICDNQVVDIGSDASSTQREIYQ